MSNSEHNCANKSLRREPPLPPMQEECCGRGCEPCIFDYYAKALEKWQRQAPD